MTDNTRNGIDAAATAASVALTYQGGDQNAIDLLAAGKGVSVVYSGGDDNYLALVAAASGGPVAYPLDAAAGELSSFPGNVGKLPASNADMTGTYTISSGPTGGSLHMAQAGILASTAPQLDFNTGGASGTAIMIEWDWQGAWADSAPFIEIQANLVSPSPFVPQLGISAFRIGKDWSLLVYINDGVSPVSLSTTTGSDSTPPEWAIVRFLAGEIRVWLPSGELSLSSDAWTQTDLTLVMAAGQTQNGNANEGKTVALTYTLNAADMPSGVVPAGTKDVFGVVIA